MEFPKLVLGIIQLLSGIPSMVFFTPDSLDFVINTMMRRDDPLYGPLVVDKVIYCRHVMPALGENSSISSLSSGHEHELL